MTAFAVPQRSLSKLSRASKTAAVGLLTILMIQGMTAQEYNPVEEGRALVTMYCADCHATGRQGESSHAIAPAFRDLHLRYDVEFLSEALVEGIFTGHPDMPEFEFDPQQAAAIVEYLKSLE
ncbi:cytochrome c [Devosia sp. MC532]|uniref:c-type cytochrome n=1 Tax=Devosia sp. MC532 TaxID=2799788 RepID=UPI0020BFD77F|nr:cytochrome c [Devosia sp. MC532]